MTREFWSSDRQFVCYEQDDQNFVLYHAATMTPLGSRFDYEAAHPDPSVLPPSPPTADPGVPVGPPPSGGGAATGPIRVIRVTQESHGPFAPRMMSDRANAWVSGQHAYVFAGSRQTGGPLFFQVDLVTGQVEPLGPKLPYRGETEGWFWLPNGRLVVLDGPCLRRINPFTSEDEIVLDAREWHPDWDLWQPHASDDGDTYSATVRQIVSSGAYPKVGTVIRTPQVRRFIKASGVLDESQVDRSGTFCVIKEDDDNRIVTIATADERFLSDASGALGHSDCGHGYIVGEANLPEPGRCVYVDLRTLERRDLFQTWNMGYVSTRGGRCLHSGDALLSLVALDGSGVTPLLAHGAGSGYDDRVKANLSPCGRVACYMVSGSVYLAVIP